MKRVLAVVVAGGLVAGALAIRAGRDHGASSSKPRLRVVCASDLGDTCDAMARQSTNATIVNEAAATTAARLTSVTAADAGIDAWLVTEPWPAIVDAARRAAGRDALFARGGRVVVARPRLALVVRRDRAAVLGRRPGCAPITWVCLGKAAQVPGGWAALGGRAEWGPLKVGHPGADTATGVAVLGQAVSEFFGRTDLSTADLDDDAFQSWFAALEQAAPRGPSGSAPVAAIVSAPGSYDAAGGTESDAAPVAANGGVQVLYPAPVVTVDVVLAGVAGAAGAGQLRDIVGRRAPLPATQGALPPAGFLDALRDRWREVTRS